MNFYRYLREAKDHTSKDAGISHLEHLEDILLSKGLNGIPDIESIIKDLFNPSLFKYNKQFIQLKVDGSPSLFFFKENNKLKIATKGIFNKEPKVASNENEISQLFDKASEDLLDKLKSAYRNLSTIKMENNVIYQGDIMFTTKSKKVIVENGIRYISFTPNVITYAIPLDSELGSKIDQANFGLVVHTKYSYSINEDGSYNMKQKPLNFDYLIRSADKYSNIVIMDNIIKGSEFIKDTDKFIKKINAIKAKSKEVKHDIISDIDNNHPKLYAAFRIFINKELDKDDYGIFGAAVQNKEINKEKLLLDIISFITSRIDKEIEKVKTKKAKDEKEKIRIEWIDYFKNNKIEVFKIIDIYYELIKLKHDILDEFKKYKLFDKAFFKEDGKFSETSDEGLVIVGSRNIIKIVDKTVFSRMNRQLAKNWK